MIHKIKALHNEGAGLSIRSIARELGISRNTVRKYLRMDEVAIGEQQANRTRRKQLDDYRDYIVTLLGRFPGLSAVKVLRKLKERHPELGVSDRSARRYIKALKETVSLRQKRYYEPVESPPGVQCQVDGGELRGLSVGGEATTVHFVVFVLSYSRLMYVGLSPRPIDAATFIRLHDAAFRYFGGRPEECVYDQTKLVVLHEQYRELDPNPAFAAYATAAGFRIYACEGYDPEGKGKVEAGVKYVKGNALAGEVFDDRDHLEAHVRQWLDGVANVRQHGTTGEAPVRPVEGHQSPDPQGPAGCPPGAAAPAYGPAADAAGSVDRAPGADHQPMPGVLRGLCRRPRALCRSTGGPAGLTNPTAPYGRQ